MKHNLHEKMQQEQNEYRAWLLAQPPEEILNHAYEYSSREDILISLENASLRPAQLRALLESQAPLMVPCSRCWPDTAQNAPAISLQQPSKCGMGMHEFPRRIEDGRILCERSKTSMRMGMIRRRIMPICNLIPDWSIFLLRACVSWSERKQPPKDNTR